MPEVVEVCATGLYLNHFLSNKKIIKMNILSGRYTRHNMSGYNDFVKVLPVIIESVNTKGKFLWITAIKDNLEYYILNTFGLEGEWTFVESKHSAVEIEVEDNDKVSKIYFSDTRNFGTMEITSDFSVLDKKLKKLGPDLLKEQFTCDQFYDRLKVLTQKNKNKPIVKVLMDQTAGTGIGCGIGNYLSVEILYKAKISPHKKIGDLIKNRILCDELAIAIKYVIKQSFMQNDIGYMGHIDTKISKWFNANKEKYDYHPEIKLNKGNFTFNVYRQDKDSLGNEVVGDKIITGRTTYWVPNIQNK